MNKNFDNLEDCIKEAFVLASDMAVEGVKGDKGGPFGSAVIKVCDNNYKIIVVESNSVLRDCDPTAHAEINAIRKASKILNKNFLEDCILITTGKSCPMCLSAAMWARIPIVYFGTNYEQATKYGFIDDDIFNYFKDNNKIIKEIEYLNEESLNPFNEWANKKNKILY